MARSKTHNMQLFVKAKSLMLSDEFVFTNHWRFFKMENQRMQRQETLQEMCTNRNHSLTMHNKVEMSLLPLPILTRFIKFEIYIVIKHYSLLVSSQLLGVLLYRICIFHPLTPLIFYISFYCARIYIYS